MSSPVFLNIFGGILQLLFFCLSSQKIENLKDTTCVSENPTRRPRSNSLVVLVTESPCRLLPEHGRVHQALHRTAADRQGKHGCGPSVL